MEETETPAARPTLTSSLTAVVVVVTVLASLAYVVASVGWLTSGSDATSAPSTTTTSVTEPAAPPSDQAATAATGGGHHGTAPVPTRALTPQEQQALDAQLAQTKAALPGATVGDALAAGYEITNRFEDVNDVHLTRVDAIEDGFDPARPPQLLAESRSLDAPLLAAVFWVQTTDPEPPDGCAGPEDQWHQHQGDLCQGSDPTRAVPADAADCLASGGTPVSYQGWMLHVWAFDGQENPDGVFAADNPCITGGRAC